MPCVELFKKIVFVYFPDDQKRLDNKMCMLPAEFCFCLKFAIFARVDF